MTYLYSLVKIFSVGPLPVFITGLVGIFLFLVINRKKSDFFPIILIMAAIFMILWRVAVTIESARYALAILFPILIFTSYFPYHFLQPFPFERFFNEKVKIGIGRFLCILLFLILTAKVLHYNPYADCYIRVSQAIEADSEKRHSSIVLYTKGDSDWLRFEYYLKRKILSVDRGLAKKENLEEQLSLYSGMYDGIYIISHNMLPESVEESSRAGFSELMSTFSNRHRRKKFYVYFFNGKPIAGEKISGENLIHNGGFEVIAPKDKHLNYIQRYEKVNNPFFLQPRNIPDNWMFGLYLGDYTEAKLEATEDAISGKYSLYIENLKDNHRFSFYCESPIPLNKSYLLAFNYQGKANTCFDLEYYFYSEKNSFLGNHKIGTFIVSDSVLHSAEILLPPPSYPEAKYARICFSVYSGAILLDDISLRIYD
jgi:hypothetical protein